MLESESLYFALNLSSPDWSLIVVSTKYEIKSRLRRSECSAVTILARLALTLSDAIVVVTTWYKLHKGKIGGLLEGNALSNILLVDGESHQSDS